jgi:APA family basic amino acid/polyamine antiporter
VAVGWSAYAVTLLGEMGIRVPPSLTGAQEFICLPDGTHAISVFNLPAMIICLALTALLVIGIRESARVNTTIVIIKVAVLAIFVRRAALHQHGEPAPFIPEHRAVPDRSAGVGFFAAQGSSSSPTSDSMRLYCLTGGQEPWSRHPIGILVSLAICGHLHRGWLVMTGLVPYASLNVLRRIAVAVQATGLKWLAPIINIGALCGLSSVILVNMLAQSRIFYSMSNDGCSLRSSPSSIRGIEPRT